MNIISVINPIYANSSNTAITCTVAFDNGNTYPYTAVSNDTTPYGQQLWSGLIAGNYGVIAAYIAPTITPAQAAATAIASGITITSTGTSALNGVYSCNQQAQSNVNAVITFILVNGTFPNGGTTMPWYDANGNPHVFPSIAEFKSFATAFANFVAAVSIYANSGGSSGSLPSSQITIP